MRIGERGGITRRMKNDGDAIRVTAELLEEMFLRILKYQLAGPVVLSERLLPKAIWCRRLMTIAIVHGLLRLKKTITKRDLYYLQKRLYGAQSTSDACLEWLASSLSSPRSTLRVVASARGIIVGDVTWKEGGQRINIKEFGSNGHLIPPSIDLFLADIDSSRIRAVIYVEKETIFFQIVAARLHDRFPVAIITGKGFADLGTRELLASLSSRNLPIYGVVDADPFGVSILATLLGSQTRKNDAQMISRGVEWVGVRPSDLVAMGHLLNPTLLMCLSSTDRKRCESLLNRKDLPESWREEIRLMMELNLKAEIELLDAVKPNYLSNQILTKMLEERKWEVESR